MTQIKSSLQPCPCPDDHIVVGNAATAYIDYVDGYPAEWGDYTADLTDLGVDRNINPTDDVDLRDLLGIPGLGTEGDTPALLFKLGSGIRVMPGDREYAHWQGYRLDCGCLKYICEGDTDVEGTGEPGSLIDCSVSLFLDEGGEFDWNCDQVEMIPVMVLPEEVGVGSGEVLDGSSDLFSVIQDTEEGSFTNYVDDHGVIYSAAWKSSADGDTIDITHITMDPRVPGEDPTGRIVKVGRGLRVFRRGVVTIVREVVRFCNDMVVVIKRGHKQMIEEFQTTFGCGDETSAPFDNFLNHGVTDEIEMIIGTTTVLSDPEEETFTWEPQVVVDTSAGETAFQLPAANGFGPLKEIPEDEVES